MGDLRRVPGRVCGPRDLGTQHQGVTVMRTVGLLLTCAMGWAISLGVTATLPGSAIALAPSGVGGDPAGIVS